ncbi:hypothetical protein NL676_025542 [Syzygium grande]|nr:hypothetical protein NL676_025542 [Syzygium grande]
MVVARGCDSSANLDSRTPQRQRRRFGRSSDSSSACRGRYSSNKDVGLAQQWWRRCWGSLQPPVGLSKDSSPQAMVKVLPLSCSCEEIFLRETALRNVTTGSPSSIFQGTTIFLIWLPHTISLFLFLCLSPTNHTKANWRLFKAEALRQRMLDDVQRCSGFSASLSSG